MCNEQNLPGSESGDNQPTTSTIKVEQLASQVKSLLLQDDSDETVLFEGETLSSFANSPKHKVSSVNSSGNQVAQTVNNHTEASPTQQTSKVELNAGVSQSDVHQESDVVQSSLITPTTHVNVTSTYTVHDSKTRMISDNIPTLTKLLESDGKLPEPNREVVTSPEERYRLCYTIDLSDSSSEEDKNNSTLQESDFPGVPGTTTGDLEANTFWNHHPIHGTVLPYTTLVL